MTTTALSQAYACDYFGFSELLTDAERAILDGLRSVLLDRVQPLLARFWEDSDFPYQVMPELAGLRLMDPPELTVDGGAGFLSRPDWPGSIRSGTSPGCCGRCARTSRGSPLVSRRVRMRRPCGTRAVYSYEGTHEINALIVGRSITGVSAFTN